LCLTMVDVENFDGTHNYDGEKNEGDVVVVGNDDIESVEEVYDEYVEEDCDAEENEVTGYREEKTTEEFSEEIVLEETLDPAVETNSMYINAPAKNAHTLAIRKIVCQDLWSEEIKDVKAGLSSLADMVRKGSATSAETVQTNRLALVRLGGHLAVVKAMDRYLRNSLVQAKGCAVLQNLALDEDLCALIGEIGGIECIVQAMKKFGKHTGVQKCGTGALRNLTQSVVDNRDAAFDVGAVQVIINSMKLHTELPELQGWACDTLANISLSGNEAKDTIIEFEGLEAIVKATRTHKKDPEVQKRAATAMQHFYST